VSELIGLTSFISNL